MDFDRSYNNSFVDVCRTFFKIEKVAEKTQRNTYEKRTACRVDLFTCKPGGSCH